MELISGHGSGGFVICELASNICNAMLLVVMNFVYQCMLPQCSQHSQLSSGSHYHESSNADNQQDKNNHQWRNDDDCCTAQKMKSSEYRINGLPM